MSKCQESKCNSNTTSSNEFNKNLCDDCAFYENAKEYYNYKGE